MQTFALNRTGLPDLTFTGELLATVTGDDPDGMTEGRYHSISTYRTDDGQYVVCIECHSPFDSEMSDSIAEAVDTVEEIEATLSLYDPAERLNSELFAQNDRTSQQAVASCLTKRFDRLVLQMLNAMESVARV
ncbi:MAG: hypothetical protein RIK87_12970 [Fuerstiella sp.]